VDLGGLLGPLAPNAIELVDRVLQQARDQLAGDGASAAGANGSSDQLRHYEELLERNSVLAAALGACDCWGQDVACPFCNGVGGPGWVRPDERLFGSYVRPALHAVTDPGSSSTIPRPGSGGRGKEGRDG
jgi:hypothetical protein